ncbi:MAG: type II secretion system protein [Planctomycetota bacterium]
MVMSRYAHQPARLGFSLIELVLVVAILGIVGAIAIPRVTRAGEDAAARSFVRTMQSFAEGAAVFNGMTGGWPADAAVGAAPVELAELVDARAWAAETPIGGNWDAMTNASGVGFAIGVVFGGALDARTSTELAKIDRILDDGSLATGNARLFSGTTYGLILERSSGARVVTGTELENLTANGSEVIGELLGPRD